MNFKSPLLKAEGLKKKYDDKVAVEALSFEVNQGEVVGLLGPNGAGKTTAFYMTIGLIRPDEGRVLFKNRDITSLPIHKRARLGMGYLAQEPSVFHSLSVEENILCVLEIMPLSKIERKNQLNYLLEEFHLTELHKKKAGTLSGGERRRLEIARTLALHPSILLLDEPFANIDPIIIADLKKIIRQLRDKGISILITDHNAREIFTVVDRSYLIQKGKILISGTVGELLQHQEARLSYFGDDFKL